MVFYDFPGRSQVPQGTVFLDPLELSLQAVEYFEEKGFDEPDPADDGVWVPGVPALIDKALLNEEGEARVPDWLYGLIKDGIVAGVGAVLGPVLAYRFGIEKLYRRTVSRSV